MKAAPLIVAVNFLPSGIPGESRAPVALHHIEVTGITGCQQIQDGVARYRQYQYRSKHGRQKPFSGCHEVAPPFFFIITYLF